MFNFIKKAGTGVAGDKDDKERRKKDKKDRKEKQKRDRASMSAEELLRLDEVRNYSEWALTRVDTRFVYGTAHGSGSGESLVAAG